MFQHRTWALSAALGTDGYGVGRLRRTYCTLEVQYLGEVARKRKSPHMDGGGGTWSAVRLTSVWEVDIQ